MNTQITLIKYKDITKTDEFGQVDNNDVIKRVVFAEQLTLTWQDREIRLKTSNFTHSFRFKIWKHEYQNDDYVEFGGKTYSIDKLQNYTLGEYSEYLSLKVTEKV